MIDYFGEAHFGNTLSESWKRIYNQVHNLRVNYHKFYENKIILYLLIITIALTMTSCQHSVPHSQFKTHPQKSSKISLGDPEKDITNKR